MQQIIINTPINSNSGTCIYRHLKSNGEVFYIGIGNLNRPFKKHGRNKWWTNIINKYPDYEIQIIKKDLTWEEACELEKILISWYGRKDLGTGTLVNMTDGGDGISNPSLELRQKIGDSQRKWDVSKEDLEKMFIIDNLNRQQISKLTGFSEVAVKRYCRKYKLIKDSKQCSLSVVNRNHKTVNKRSIINIETGEIFETCKEASEKYNININTLRAYLLGTSPNKTNLIYNATIYS